MSGHSHYGVDLGVLEADGSSAWVYWAGGIGAFILEASETSGTIGGGTCSLEYATGGPGSDGDEAIATRQAYQGQAFDSTNTNLTAFGIVAITGPEGFYRMDLTGSTAPKIAGYLRPASIKLKNQQTLG